MCRFTPIAMLWTALTGLNAGWATPTLDVSNYVSIDPELEFGPFLPDRIIIEVNGEPLGEQLGFGATSSVLELPGTGSFSLRVSSDSGEFEPVVRQFSIKEDGHHHLLLIGDELFQPWTPLVLARLPESATEATLRVVHAASLVDSDVDWRLSLVTDAGVPALGASDLDYANVGVDLLDPDAALDLKVMDAEGRVAVDVAPLALSAETARTLVITGRDLDSVAVFELGGIELDKELAVDLTANGLFYDPEQPGQGAHMMPLVHEDRLLGYFYTFTADGSEQAWYLFDSCNSQPNQLGCATPAAFDGQTAPVTFYRLTGGTLAQGEPAPVNEVVGVGQITFLNCDRVAIEADLGGEGQYSLDYRRLSPRFDCFQSSDLR